MDREGKTIMQNIASTATEEKNITDLIIDETYPVIIIINGVE